RRVWQANLRGSVEARLESRGKEGGHGGWSRMDLESCRSTFSGRSADRRSVSRPPAPLGAGAQTTSQRPGESESLDEGLPKAPARQGQNRKTGVIASL